jgi:hypothetical protein
VRLAALSPSVDELNGGIGILTVMHCTAYAMSGIEVVLAQDSKWRGTMMNYGSTRPVPSVTGSVVAVSLNTDVVREQHILQQRNKVPGTTGTIHLPARSCPDKPLPSGCCTGSGWGGIENGFDHVLYQYRMQQKHFEYAQQVVHLFQYTDFVQNRWLLWSMTDQFLLSKRCLIESLVRSLVQVRR